jgi:hypothetical protein
MNPYTVKAIVITGLVLIGVGVLAARAPHDNNQNFIGKPVIEFSGRIYDHASGKGVPDAFVIVNLEAWFAVPFVGHGRSGCVGGEVVRTDANGNYRFVWDWRKELNEGPPKDVSVLLKAYAPGWEYYPTTRRKGTSWQLADYDGPDIELTPDQATLDERLPFLAKINDNACMHGPRAKSFEALHAAHYEEIWRAVCTRDGEAYADLAWPRFSVVEGTMVYWRMHASNNIRKSVSESERYDRMYELGDIGRRSMPAFERPEPRNATGYPPGRALTAEEKAAMCEWFRPEHVAQWVSP